MRKRVVQRPFENMKGKTDRSSLAPTSIHVINRRTLGLKCQRFRMRHPNRGLVIYNIYVSEGLHSTKEAEKEHKWYCRRDVFSFSSSSTDSEESLSRAPLTQLQINSTPEHISTKIHCTQKNVVVVFAATTAAAADHHVTNPSISIARPHLN